MPPEPVGQPGARLADGLFGVAAGVILTGATRWGHASGRRSLISTREREGQPAIFSEIADEAATARFFERVATYQREIERRRFGGEAPVVRPRPRRVFEAAAAVVAAERLHGVVQLDDETAVSPTEDLAADELYGALRALAVWDFGRARSRLETAGSLAYLPHLQQQISLARGLYHVSRAVFVSEPRVQDKWAGEERAVLDLLPTLDRLPPGAAEFYGQEVQRLVATWEEARTDDLAWTGWALARARGASRDGGRETQLAWLLRVYRRHAERLAGDSHLTALVEEAEALFRLLLPGVTDEERSALETQSALAWPRDLFPALVASLNRSLGVDVLEVSNRFALMIYRAPSVAEGVSS